MRKVVATPLINLPRLLTKKDEVGMAGSKSTQTRFVRDNHIHYTSLHLLFLIIMHLLMSICSLSAAYMGDIQLVPCHMA